MTAYLVSVLSLQFQRDLYILHNDTFIGQLRMLWTVGLCGPEWVIVAADSSVSTSIIGTLLS
jgi:hypothetical protein